MTNVVNFAKQTITLVVGIIALFITWVTISTYGDIGFLKGEISEYSYLCIGDVRDFTCDGYWSPQGSFATYKVNSKSHEVISKSNYGVTRYKDCAVSDRKNWTCTFEDKSGEFGFRDGVYYRIDFKTTPLTEGLANNIRYSAWLPWFVAQIGTLFREG